MMVEHPEPHCSLCGGEAETHYDDAYTQCCNEPICYGADGDLWNRHAPHCAGSKEED